MNKNLYVFENHIYEVIDETQTHYVCSPKNNNEGYGYIPKEKGFSLEIHEKLFNLSNRNLEEIKKYNQWIAKEGYFDYGIFVCSECNKYIFGQGEQEEHLCEECKDKDNFYVLIKYSDGYFLSRIFKRYQEAHSTMKAEVEKEASSYYKDLNELPYDDIVVCEEHKGFVAGNVSQEDVYWKIEKFNSNQI